MVHRATRGGTVVAAGLALFGCSLLVTVDDDVSGAAPDATTEAGAPDDARAADAVVVDTASDAADAADGATGCDSSDPSLVAFFRFDEGAGITTNDCSASKLVASAMGSSPTVKWTQGHSGGAIDFGGTTCLDVGPVPAVTFATSAFTVSAWIHVRAFFMPDNTGRWIVSRKPGDRGWHFGTDDPNKVELDLETTGSKFQGNATISGSEWTHAATVWTPGDKILVYVNGELAASHPNAPASIGVDPNARLRIGCRTPNSSLFDGIIDDLRIHSRALSAAEIDALAR